MTRDEIPVIVRVRAYVFPPAYHTLDCYELPHVLVRTLSIVCDYPNCPFQLEIVLNRGLISHINVPIERDLSSMLVHSTRTIRKWCTEYAWYVKLDL